MSFIDVSSPETYAGESVTVFRRAMPLSLSSDIAAQALELLIDTGWDVNQSTERKFRASPVLPIDRTIPILARLAHNLLDTPLSSSTMRINWQEEAGKQAWHQDYIPEPLVIYPVGEGSLDLAPDAVDVRDARTAQERGAVISIPIQAGDIAIVHKGDEVFHRGRNLSSTEPRITIALH